MTKAKKSPANGTAGAETNVNDKIHQSPELVNTIAQAILDNTQDIPFGTVQFALHIESGKITRYTVTNTKSVLVGGGQ